MQHFFTGFVSFALLTACYEIVDKVEPSAPTQLPATLDPATAENNPPIISGNPSATATIGRIWSFTPSVSDPDGDPISLDIENKPSWATFDQFSGRLSGIPLLGQNGEYDDILISVSDGQHTTTLPAFAISVQNFSSNNGPFISGTPITSAFEGQLYSFIPVASDPENDNLTFSIANRPPWAVFLAESGELAGIPIAIDAGIHGNIVISVSDGLQSVSLPPFDISVQGNISTNRAPIISGIPASQAIVDQLYSFQPTASDPDGDELLFAIANLPGWATFDSSSGRLTGTPDQGDVSVYENIQIFVGDDNLTSSIPLFSITVLQSASGSVKLNWIPPIENTNGSSLTNLTGYKIYYGTASENYSNEIRLNNPGLTAYVLDNLSPNSYFFVLTSINDQGFESDLSNEIVVTIN